MKRWHDFREARLSLDGVSHIRDRQSPTLASGEICADIIALWEVRLTVTASK